MRKHIADLPERVLVGEVEDGAHLTAAKSGGGNVAHEVHAAVVFEGSGSFGGDQAEEAEVRASGDAFHGLELFGTEPPGPAVVEGRKSSRDGKAVFPESGGGDGEEKVHAKPPLKIAATYRLKRPFSETRGKIILRALNYQ